MQRLLLVALAAEAAADFQPCSSTSSACCNPSISPPQICPGNIACQPCGGGNACECPSGPSPSPSLAPPPPGPTSDTRLTVVNGCRSGPIWIAHIVAGAVGPDPQNVKIISGESAQFHTGLNGGGLSATRLWPKFGCDGGSNCTIGSSGGPGEGCVIRVSGKPDDYSHCAPPVDSKFEATFAAPGSSSFDIVDMSLVDGYSLPFKLETVGGSCTRAQQPFTDMDCSGLSLDKCPTVEVLDGKTVSLLATNPKTGAKGGCFSPCMKLTDDKWNIDPVAPGSQKAGPYCCAGSYGSPDQCKRSPSAILSSQYLKAVKESCPAAYGYAYDDKTATIACTTSTQYIVTFYCPAGASGAFPTILT